MLQHVVTEFNHMTGIGPSLMEKVAADPMLSTLAKAFSVKSVKPADVKFILYRKVGHGVELEDVASRFGDILTSVEQKEADPKALMAFLKKHGAKPAPKVESLDEQVYSVLGPGPTAAGGSDAAKFCADITKGVKSAVRGKFFQCRPNLKFGIGGASIDYANIAASEKPGSLVFLNAKVQVRLTVSGFDAEGNLTGAKVKVEKLTAPRGIKFRAKTGTPEQVIKAIVSAVKKAASVEESLSENVAGTILKQMGGYGRLKAMIGATHFIDHGKSLSFQFPNRKRSKGNLVKVTLRSDDTYDMEFSAISGGGTKVKKVKTYSGIYFDQLQPLFTEWTGLYLSL